MGFYPIIGKDILFVNDTLHHYHIVSELHYRQGGQVVNAMDCKSIANYFHILSKLCDRRGGRVVKAVDC